MKNKKFHYYLEYIIIFIIYIILNLLPINVVSFLGGFLFKLFGSLTKYNEIAKKNFLIIFPLANNQEVQKNLSKSWQNLGSTFFELLILPKILKNSKKFIKLEGLENIKQNKTNQNYIFVGIHQSNWELITPMIDKIGFNIGAVYRHINNPFINKLILKKRMQSLKNSKSFYTPKGKQSAIDIIKAVKKKFSAFIVIDQKDSAGEKIPLFKLNVKTQTGFLKIAKKNGIKIIPVENTREGLNNFNIKFHKSLTLNLEEFNSLNEMQKIHSIIEKWIKKDPSNWLLQHNRFN